MNDEREYAEHAAVVLEGMGLPRAYGKLLAWLMVCDPPQQSGTQLAQALDLSRGSVSMGTRILENNRLIRRVPGPGRHKVYEMTEDAIMRATQSDNYRIFRELMDRGVQLLGGEDAPRAQRLRRNRDFYAFMERELPRLVDRFKAEYGDEHRG
ncbi:MAG TPA: MarR family transcriptional regulator [Rugosimonospora sp.]|nr:MarR family transcriptional regulator [Rugosimonospora sp.]